MKISLKKQMFEMEQFFFFFFWVSWSFSSATDKWQISRKKGKSFLKTASSNLIGWEFKSVQWVILRYKSAR